MGNTNRTLGMNYVVNDRLDDPKWKEYGIQLDTKDYDSCCCKAIFPEGWTFKKQEIYDDFTHDSGCTWYDQDYVPRIMGFENRYGRFNKFLKINNSITELEKEQEILNNIKLTCEENKKNINYIRQHTSLEQKDNKYIICKYNDYSLGNPKFVGYYNNKTSIQQVIAYLEKKYSEYTFRCVEISDKLILSLDKENFIDSLHSDFSEQKKLDLINNLINELNIYGFTKRYLDQIKNDDIVIDV